MNLIEDILVEWSYRVHDGMPKVNDTYHLVILEDILQERKYPRLFIEILLQNLRQVREDRVKKYSKSARRVVNIDPEGKTFKKNPDNYTDEIPSDTQSKTTTPTKTIQKSKIPRPEYFNTFAETRNNVIKKGAVAILDVANDITKNAINVTGKGVGGPAAFFGESQTTDLINKIGNGTETRSLDEFLNDMLTKPAPDGIKGTPIYDKIDDPDNVKRWLTSAYNGAVSELSDIKSDPDTKFGKQKQPYPIALTVNDNGMSATRTLIEEKLKKSKEGSSDYNHYKNELSIYDDLVDEKFYEYLTHYYPTRPWKDEKGYLFRHRDLAPEQKLDGLMHVYEPPLQGYHVFHEDWNSMQLLWASRMLIGMVYLNDVWVGGETEFLHQKVKIKPKQEHLLCGLHILLIYIEVIHLSVIVSI